MNVERHVNLRCLDKSGLSGPEQVKPQIRKKTIRQTFSILKGSGEKCRPTCGFLCLCLFDKQEVKMCEDCGS